MRWVEITEHQYDYALGEMYPRDWKRGGFYCAENWFGDTAAFFQKLGGKFYKSYQRLGADRDVVLEELKAHIAATVLNS